MTQPTISPEEALEGFFQTVRDQALKDPAFKARLIESLGFTVVLRGDEALAALDPVLLALGGQENFRNTMLSFTLPQLKKIVKHHITAEEFRAANTKEKLVAAMWQVAQSQFADQVPKAGR